MLGSCFKSFAKLDFIYRHETGMSCWGSHFENITLRATKGDDSFSSYLFGELKLLRKRSLNWLMKTADQRQCLYDTKYNTKKSGVL